MSDKTKATVRLAIREEGEFVNAYLAQPAVMEGALLIGSIAKGLLNMRPALFEQFQALMTEAMVAGVEVGLGGKVTECIQQPAPEHERAGHA